MTKITTNQYILIAVFCILTSKLMTMPTVIFNYAGKDAVFSVMLNIAIELILVLLITGLIKKYNNTTFFELLKLKFKKIIAIIIASILALFLLFKGVFLIQETISFFTLSLFQSINMWLLIIPSILTILYISYKGLSAIGRSIDIYWVFVFLALIIVFVISITKVDFTANLPYFENGFLPFLTGSMHSLFYVGNSLILLLFMGKVEIKPSLFKYTSLFSCGMAFFATFNIFIFYNLFENFVPYCTFALSNLSQYNPFVTELGHIGWLSIIESTINLIFMSSIFCYCVRQYLQFSFCINKKIVAAIISGGLYFVVMYLFSFDLYKMLAFIKDYAYIYSLVLIPIIIILCIVLHSTYKKPSLTTNIYIKGKQNAKV